MIDIPNILTVISSFIASLTIVLGFWNRYIYKPTQDRREKREAAQTQKLVDTIKEASEPHLLMLRQTREDVDTLTELAQRSLELHIKHSDQLSKHHERIIILETKNGIRQYTEQYGVNNHEIKK